MLKILNVPLLITVICVLAASQVWLSHVRVGAAQTLTELKQDRLRVQQNVQNLKLELVSLMRPDTLRRLAREKLGMHAPTSMQVVKP